MHAAQQRAQADVSVLESKLVQAQAQAAEPAATPERGEAAVAPNGVQIDHVQGELRAAKDEIISL